VLFCEAKTGCINIIQENFRLQRDNLRQEGSNIAITQNMTVHADGLCIAAKGRSLAFHVHTFSLYVSNASYLC
jgi:hypothetical protein